VHPASFHHLACPPILTSVDSHVQTAAAITDEELWLACRHMSALLEMVESESEPADTDSQLDAAAVTLTVALQRMNNVCAYLDAAGFSC